MFSQCLTEKGGAATREKNDVISTKGMGEYSTANIKIRLLSGHPAA